MDPSQLTEFLVFITVKAGREDAFLRGAFANQASSREEPGNLRFDMYRNSENQLEFLFAEKYNSVNAVTTHRQTPHFLSFYKTLEVTQEFPRRREPGNTIPSNYKSIAQ
jgi:autoinducer 2-degrading protein